MKISKNKQYKNYLEKNSLKFIDLFAGIGGFRVAFSEHGAQCVFSSEWDKHAAITYKANFSHQPEGDITKIQEKNIPKHNLICAGFPCQAFSISGKRDGFNDTRGTLFFDIARIAKNHRPEILVLENVKNLVGHDGGKTLKKILQVLDEIGYSTYYEILNASFYGVAQSRERVYFVCFRKDLNIDHYSFPKPTMETISLNDIIEENIDDRQFEISRPDITISRDESTINDDFIGAALLKPIRIGTINKGGQGERIYSPKGHAITLSAYGGGAAGKTGAYLIKNKVRQLTPRECLRAQGFPESYSFPPSISKSQAYKMCGNSVSVPVLQNIYYSILDTLIRNNIKLE
ncbi:DNA (cytosine-5-)-methyltransferase [Polynucleobacter sp. 73C-SIWE]|uniref:DNA (cytosine-5-)-methyltransferase n=1 Tax=Polynucleobacter sp. 73C-SIWE TaxID=2689098 RepID=UPI001C0E6D7C|nr:DNA (cytosine-5-)-methyltransferase [Polynucleobacter sp. 73C-SIWE]MBU3579764.1 DNA (cytosine-5-)-methyltransferase [Polynucleobacter sp. 73C-SIWE]